jgi:hypothetical protein
VIVENGVPNCNVNYAFYARLAVSLIKAMSPNSEEETSLGGFPVPSVLNATTSQHMRPSTSILFRNTSNSVSSDRCFCLLTLLSREFAALLKRF